MDLLEYILPPDLKNIGVKCTSCGSALVIYYISNPSSNFPAGAYCYKCLLAACRRSHQLPYPIETGLLDKLRVDLGIDPHKSFFVVPNNLLKPKP